MTRVAEILIALRSSYRSGASEVSLQLTQTLNFHSLPFEKLVYELRFHKTTLCSLYLGTTTCRSFFSCIILLLNKDIVCTNRLDLSKKTAFMTNPQYDLLGKRAKIFRMIAFKINHLFPVPEWNFFRIYSLQLYCKCNIISANEYFYKTDYIENLAQYLPLIH